MIYDVRHLTTYSYEKPVTFARCALRLAPRAASDQLVLASDLIITPTPLSVSERIGPFGERVVTATIETPHRKLEIDARSRVDVRRPPHLAPLGGEPWEAAREQAFAVDTLGPESPAQFLYPSRKAPLSSAITAYVAQSFPPRRPIIEAAFDLTCRMRREFSYDPESTEVSTPAIEAFEARHGVCQDFAHIMIAGLRGIGLPAAYVSGYLRTYPAPGRPRLEGADAAHAWVDLWCGDRERWIGLDPTNGLIVAGDHVVVAVGRDYADVAPIGGVVLGPGEQKVDVGVDVVPVD